MFVGLLCLSVLYAGKSLSCFLTGEEVIQGAVAVKISGCRWEGLQNGVHVDLVTWVPNAVSFV